MNYYRVRVIKKTEETLECWVNANSSEHAIHKVNLDEQEFRTIRKSEEWDNWTSDEIEKGAN